MDEEPMEVDVEHQLPSHRTPPPPSSSPSNRLSLGNSLQTNFGNDYVFQICSKFDWSLLGVSLSSNVVKLYSPSTGQCCGECRGHTDSINHMSFSGPSSPHLIVSSSSDGTIRGWDTRSFKEVSRISAGPSQEVFSFSFGGSGDYLLSAGCKSQILFWDWRNKKQVACLEDCHGDDVTQVLFVPQHPNKLISASLDGLICSFDTAGDINDDDNLDAVINVGTSVGKVGIFGQTLEKIWCLTQIETLSVFDWKNGTSYAHFQDARTSASDSWNQDHVDYFVDCHSCGSDSLWVIGGTNAGTLGYFPVNYIGNASIGPPEAILSGGHTGVVRSVLPTSNTARPNAKKDGIFGWTGGEDGHLCCWFSDNSPGVSRSWMSGSLSLKSSKKHQKKNRHQPY
ncbi:hypothetical protein MLD38_021656 [Melastoma candidum]|uniref:Uncharacterized protein n=1 Tax=Melastoma candidum TaxID=119954 RepID=A0ACB9QH99_9MYRT|nr:hypothetical protein MLD38_021656 [Melastoma candidum]